jgi:hypothetical protein
MKPNETINFNETKIFKSYNYLLYENCFHSPSRKIQSTNWKCNTQPFLMMPNHYELNVKIFTLILKLQHGQTCVTLIICRLIINKLVLPHLFTNLIFQTIKQFKLYNWYMHCHTLINKQLYTNAKTKQFYEKLTKEKIETQWN